MINRRAHGISAQVDGISIAVPGNRKKRARIFDAIGEATESKPEKRTSLYTAVVHAAAEWKFIPGFKGGRPRFLQAIDRSALYLKSLE
jgi:hypothetical protein